MKKIIIFCVASMILSILLGCLSPQVDSAPKAEETRVIGYQNFTLVGFWKIEQKFIVDEKKSTENTAEWMEVSVPREKYIQFKEGGENCLSEEELLVLSPDQIPQISIIPSPALAGGYIPSGVCYLLKDPDQNATFAYGLLLNGKDIGSRVGGIGTELEAKELMNLYTFQEGKLELFSRDFEHDNEGNVVISLVYKNTLSPSTQAAAEADGWPYSTETE